MKFDTQRAMAWAGRLAPDPGGGISADLVAEELDRLGLRVRPFEGFDTAFSRRVLPGIGWCVFGLGVTPAAFPGSPTWLRVSGGLAGLAGLLVAIVPGLRFGTRWRPGRPRAGVWAERPAEGAPAVRVVVMAPLDEAWPGRGIGPWWTSSTMITALAAGLLLMSSGVYPTPSGWLARWVLLGLLWGAIAARVRVSWNPMRPPNRSDNRLGLGILLELARTWPRRADARMEAHFVAYGGDAVVGPEEEDRPTLRLDLRAPGKGRGLVLASRTLEALATSAASDLWIPHRTARRRPWARLDWPAPASADDTVCLIGEAAFAARPGDPPSAIDPEAVGRAAQLATEIAWRWARRMPGKAR